MNEELEWLKHAASKLEECRNLIAQLKDDLKRMEDDRRRLKAEGLKLRSQIQYLETALKTHGQTTHQNGPQSSLRDRGATFSTNTISGDHTTK